MTVARHGPQPAAGLNPSTIVGDYSESAGLPATSTLNLAAILESLAEVRGWMSRPAVRDAERTWSHAEVHQGGHRAAQLMADAGVRPGDRVLIAAADCVQLVWGILGAARAGAIAVLVNPLLPEADHDFMVHDSSPALVLCDRLLEGRFADVPTVPIDELSTAPFCQFPAVEVRSDTPAYAQYTSGTTGKPRAALHRHLDPICFYRAMGPPILRLRPDDVICSVSKAYFAYGLGNSVLFPLQSGCSAVLDPNRPSVDEVGALVARHRVTVLFAVPSFYAGMVSRGDARCYSSVRLAISAGEALLPVLYDRVLSWLSCEILDGLGSTEVGQTFISNIPGRSRPGTIGTVLPGYEATIRDKSGQGVPAGQTGALWVRGDSIMLGYLNRPDETAAVLVDGWCLTGDRASVDSAGYYYHHGRLDDMEMVGGNNVSPLEVEAVLLEHPAVVEIAVAAVPDETGATRLRCFAVLTPGRCWSLDLENEILGLARGRLAPFKVPRSVRVVDALPRTATGKLRRHILRGGWQSPQSPQSPQTGGASRPVDDSTPTMR